MSGEVAEALPPVEESTQAGAAADEAKAEQSTDPPEGSAPKPEKTAEQREIERLRRGIDRRTRQIGELRARLTQPAIERNNRDDADDSQPLSLTKAEIAQLVKAEAEKLAPTLAEQRQEVQRRQGVIDSLAKTWGQEKFDEVASDLDAAFGGLQDASGRPRAAIEAVFEADDPARVIEWLADPENADEAERISRLSAVQAGKAVARLEAKLDAERESQKPRVSKAPTPIAPARGSAPVQKSPADMSDAEYAIWRKGKGK